MNRAGRKRNTRLCREPVSGFRVAGHSEDWHLNCRPQANGRFQTWTSWKRDSAIKRQWTSWLAESSGLPGHTSVILEHVTRVAGQTLPIHMLRFGASFLPMRGCVRRELVEDSR
jgi:hypothetical protein